MTLSAHKIYGSKGIGLLYRKLQITNYKLQTILTGGGQEFGLRSATENVPAIVGFSKAAELAIKNREKEMKRITQLRDYFWQKLKKICPAAEINGLIDKTKSLPNILNVYFPNHDAQDLLMKLDFHGVAVSAGSACSARSTKQSHVLKALGCPEKRIKNSLRFSLGSPTTKKEINEALKRMREIKIKFG